MDKAVLPVNDQLATKIKPKQINIPADPILSGLTGKGAATAKAEANYQNEYVRKWELKNGETVKAVSFPDIIALDKLFISKSNTMQPTIEDTNEYIGMWVTKDGYIRHELLPDNRYDEARGKRKSAYQGSYKVSGNHIDYKDDTGFSADGDFKEGILYHAGMILYKEK